MIDECYGVYFVSSFLCFKYRSLVVVLGFYLSILRAFHLIRACINGFVLTRRFYRCYDDS